MALAPSAVAVRDADISTLTNADNHIKLAKHNMASRLAKEQQLMTPKVLFTDKQKHQRTRNKRNRKRSSKLPTTSVEPTKKSRKNALIVEVMKAPRPVHSQPQGGQATGMIHR